MLTALSFSTPGFTASMLGVGAGGGLGCQTLVVQFAVGGASDGVDGEDALGCLVGGEVLLDVGDQSRAVDLVAGVWFDERGDGLAPLLVGQSDDGGVGDGGVELEAFLDFFGIHLLAAGVDALAAAAEQHDGAVGVDGGVVAGDRVALAVDGDEGLGGLGLVLVVPDRGVAAQRDPAEFTGS